MKETVYQRGLARRSVQHFAPDDPELPAFAAQTGPRHWISEVEECAADVLARLGHTFGRDRLGLHLVTPVDENALSAEGRAALVIEYVRAANVAVNSDAMTAFEWGVKLGQAALHLQLELAGWPLAAELGDKQIKNVRSGGVKEAIKRRQEARERSALAQRAAEAIWQRRPDLDNHAVAIQVARENPSLGSANTIRRKIRRPG